jgi:hypothetical protein
MNYRLRGTGLDCRSRPSSNGNSSEDASGLVLQDPCTVGRTRSSARAATPLLLPSTRCTNTRKLALRVCVVERKRHACVVAMYPATWDLTTG